MRKSAPPPERFSATMRPLVGLHDGLADGQAEPGAARAVAVGGAVEALEDARLLAGRQARTAVGDLDQRRALRAREAHLDRASPRACT